MFKLSAQKVLVIILASFSVTAFSAPDVRTLADGSKLYDPTKPKGWNVVTPKQAKVNYKLNYILRSENSSGRRQAIVNGKKVTEGDIVSGAKVIRIRDNAVVLSVSGKQRVLEINKAKRVIQ